MAILRRAKSLTEANVVRRFSSSNGITKRSFARHSSANEFDTTLTPSKSSTTLSLFSMSGNKRSRACAPNCLVPSASPISLNLNVTITYYILPKVIQFVLSTKLFVELALAIDTVIYHIVGSISLLECQFRFPFSADRFFLTTTKERTWS